MIDNEQEVKQAIRINPCNFYYAKDNYKVSDEIMKECILLKANTYQYASKRLRSSIEFAVLFPRQGGSFSSLDKHLRDRKKLGLTAVEVKPNSFQYLIENLGDDDDVLLFAIKNNKNIKGYASERARYIFLSYQKV